jgi:hypothetical protein
MQFPNVASLALIAALIAALEFVAAGAEGVSSEWGIPALVLVLGAIAKALQVYLQRAESEARALDSQPSQLRRWLLD